MEEVNIKITTDTSGATKNVNNLSQEIKSAVVPSIALAEGIKMGVDAVIEFGKASIEAYKEAVDSVNRLNFALENMGGEGEAALKRLTDQADELEGTSLFDVERIQETQTKLIQSLGLTSKEVEGLTPKIVELASAQGIDMSQATDQVINGLNGQEKALKKAGVEFESTGDKTKDLANLMQGLDKFAGASAISLEKNGKGVRELEVQFGKLQEKVGEDLVKAYNDFGDAIFNTEEFFSGQTKVVEALTMVYDQYKSMLSDVSNKIIDAGDAQRDATIIYYQDIKSRRELTFAENKIYTELLKNQTAALEANNKRRIEQLKKETDKQKEKTEKTVKELSDYEKLIAKQKELDTAITEAITDGDTAKANQLSYEYGMVSFQIDKINLSAEQAKNGIEELNRQGLNQDAFKVNLPTQLAPVEVPVDDKTEVLPDGTRVTSDEYQEYLLKADESAQLAVDRYNMVSDATFQILNDRFAAQTQLELEQVDKEKTLLDQKYSYEEEKAMNKANSDKLSESQKQIVMSQLNEKKLKEQADLDKREADIRKKAFNREKALNISKIILNAAVEAAKISGIIASFISGVATAPLAAAGVSQLITLGISTAAQTAVIAAQKPPAFARGGLVSGPGTGTSDSIDARISNGESIINADSTSMFMPLLSAINQVGGGRAFKADVLTPVGTVTTPSQPIIKTYVTESDMTSSQKSARRRDNFSKF